MEKRSSHVAFLDPRDTVIEDPQLLRSGDASLTYCYSLINFICLVYAEFSSPEAETVTDYKDCDFWLEIESVRMGPVIGSGQFSTVHLGEYFGDLVAVKKQTREQQVCLLITYSIIRIRLLARSMKGLGNVFIS